LRSKGAQNGCILGLPAGEAVSQAHIDKAVAAAKAAPSMAGLDLAKVVSVTKSYDLDTDRMGTRHRLRYAGCAALPRGGV
jgi:carbamoylphosphate synthase small subunit